MRTNLRRFYFCVEIFKMCEFLFELADGFTAGACGSAAVSIYDTFATSIAASVYCSFAAGVSGDFAAGVSNSFAAV